MGEHSAIVGKVESIEKSLEVARSTLDIRLSEAKESLEGRLRGMNEFRDQLKDQAARFITREELSVIITRFGDDIKDLRTFKDKMSGMATQKSLSFVQLIALLSLAVSVFGLFLRK
jgi:uncharacterized protein YegL